MLNYKKFAQIHINCFRIFSLEKFVDVINIRLGVKHVFRNFPFIETFEND